MTLRDPSESAQDAKTGAGPESNLPIVAVLLTRSMREQVLSPEVLVELAEKCQLRTIDTDRLTQTDLPCLLDEAVACLTGWGTPSLDDDILAKSPSLKLIAHTAGSVRKLLPVGEIGSSIRVSHAAGVMADSVAEFVVSSALLAMRRIDLIDHEMRNGGDWFDLRTRYLGRLLGAQTIGLIGAGYVGRTVIRFLKPFGSKILVVDPVMTAEHAEAIGVELTTMETLLSTSDIVSLHAPVLPETRGMIGAEQLSLLRDGALFINSARSALIDEAALLAELRSGRIHAVVDVFDTEPLPLDSEFRSVHHAQITPHVAGHSTDTHRRQGKTMVEEVLRFLQGDPLHHEITAPMLAIMA